MFHKYIDSINNSQCFYSWKHQYENCVSVYYSFTINNDLLWFIDFCVLFVEGIAHFWNGGIEKRRVKFKMQGIRPPKKLSKDFKTIVEIWFIFWDNCTMPHSTLFHLTIEKVVCIPLLPSSTFLVFLLWIRLDSSSWPYYMKYNFQCSEFLIWVRLFSLLWYAKMQRIIFAT